MNLGKNFLGFLGRPWTRPLKLSGESMTFVKKANRGFSGPKGGCCGGGTIGGFGGPLGSCCGGRVEKNDEILNGSG